LRDEKFESGLFSDESDELSPSSDLPQKVMDLFQASVRSLAQGLAYESLSASIEAALAHYFRRSISGRSAAPNHRRADRSHRPPSRFS
jgi:hypothetical protein